MPALQQNAAASCTQLKDDALFNCLSGSRFRHLEEKVGLAVLKPTSNVVRPTAAAPCGTLRHVAEWCGVLHCLVSRSKRQMENSINAGLLARSVNGVKPPSTGQRVLKMARMILEQVDTLIATATSEGRGDSGRL